MKCKAKGYRTERKAVALLEREGYTVVRAGGSLGPFDLVALSRSGVRLIQVKTNRPPSVEEMQRIASFSNLLPGAVREVWLFRDYCTDPQVIRA